MQRLIKSDCFDCFSSWERCKFFVFIILLSDLDHWTISSHSCNHSFSAHGMNSEFSFCIYPFLTCSFNNLFMKWTIKLGNHLISFLMPSSDLIKRCFNIGCEPIIHNIWKILIQKISHNHSNITWEHFLFFSSSHLLSFFFYDFIIFEQKFKIFSFFSWSILFEYISSFKNSRNCRSIGWWSTNPLFFKLFYEACLRISWWMLLKLLARENFLLREAISLI